MPRCIGHVHHAQLRAARHFGGDDGALHLTEPRGVQLAAPQAAVGIDLHRRLRVSAPDPIQQTIFNALHGLRLEFRAPVELDQFQRVAMALEQTGQRQVCLGNTEQGGNAYGEGAGCDCVTFGPGRRLGGAQQAMGAQQRHRGGNVLLSCIFEAGVGTQGIERWVGHDGLASKRRPEAEPTLLNPAAARNVLNQWGAGQSAAQIRVGEGIGRP